MIARDVICLDEEGFKRYLKKTGKSERKIEFDIRKMKKFEADLLEHLDKIESLSSNLQIKKLCQSIKVFLNET